MKNKFNPNQRAHQCLSVFHTICDDFNDGKLDPKHHDFEKTMTPGYLRVLQSMTLEAFDLIKYLHSKENSEATKAYMIFCGKVLLRLSHLIHNHRVETEAEIANYFDHFMVKLREIGGSDIIDESEVSIYTVVKESNNV